MLARTFRPSTATARGVRTTSVRSFAAQKDDAAVAEYLKQKAERKKALASVKVPLLLTTPAGKEATELFQDVMLGKSSVEATETALRNLYQAKEKIPAVQALFTSPSMSLEDKLEGFKAVAQKVMSNSPDAVSFVGTKMLNKQTGNIWEVCEAFFQLAGRHRGELKVDVTSAKPLTDEARNTIVTFIKKANVSGDGEKTVVKLTETVDADIIGGLVVRCHEPAHLLVDTSYKTMFQQVQSEIDRKFNRHFDSIKSVDPNSTTKKVVHATKKDLADVLLERL